MCLSIHFARERGAPPITAQLLREKWTQSRFKTISSLCARVDPRAWRLALRAREKEKGEGIIISPKNLAALDVIENIKGRQNTPL